MSGKTNVLSFRSAPLVGDGNNVLADVLASEMPESKRGAAFQYEHSGSPSQRVSRSYLCNDETPGKGLIPTSMAGSNGFDNIDNPTSTNSCTYPCNEEGSKTCSRIARRQRGMYKLRLVLQVVAATMIYWLVFGDIFSSGIIFASLLLPPCSEEIHSNDTANASIAMTTSRFLAYNDTRLSTLPISEQLHTSLNAMSRNESDGNSTSGSCGGFGQSAASTGKMYIFPAVELSLESRVHKLQEYAIPSSWIVVRHQNSQSHDERCVKRAWAACESKILSLFSLGLQEFNLEG